MDETEYLVDESGIRMWMDKPWREKISKRMLFAIIGVIVAILVLLAMLLDAYGDKDRLEARLAATKKENARLVKLEKAATKELDAAKIRIDECTKGVELAWKAWARRNEVFSTALGNIYRADTELIEEDNTLAALNFYESTEECAPYIDPKRVFGYEPVG